jgi:CzcA family heavy metal efflux pump
MMRGMIGSCLNFRFLVVILAAVLLIFGVTQFSQMPLDVLPELSPPYVEIQTEALGLSAEEVEQMITVPMEQDLLAGVAWLDVIRSESVPGLSSILVYFEPGTDLYQGRQMVAERIAQSAVGLPNVSKPPTMIQPLSSASRFMIVGLSSKDLPLIQMSVLAHWTIAPRLMGVPGVAHVAIWGDRDRQLQVLVDPMRLQAQDVSLEQVVKTAGNALWVSPLSFLEASTPGTGGFIDTPNQRLGVWHILPISSPEELAQVPVEGAEPLLLGDVAQVVEDHQPLIGDALINDSPNLLLVIEKLPGTNTLEVTRGVESALDALRPGFASIDFDATLFRPATFIEMAIGNLANSLLLGAFLLTIVLLAFLREWRAALVSLITIPISLTAALLVLYLRGVTLNTMVLLGLIIALGAIVDDAIIDVDQTLRRLRQNLREGEPKSVERVILEASVEMRGAIFSAVLITLLVALPLFFLEGVSGALFQPLATSYVLAVLASMLVALIITPALSQILLSEPLLPRARLANRATPFWVRLQAGYERALERTAQKPWLAYAVATILGLAGLAALPFLGQDRLLPSFREPYLTIGVEGASATSHPEMNRIVSRISSELRSISGVNNVGAHVGRAVFGDQVVGINSAQLWVSIDPKAGYKATMAAIQQTVDGYIGLDLKVQTYLQKVLEQEQTNSSNAITVRLFGEDEQILQSEVEKLRKVVMGVDGVVAARVALPEEEPTVEIEVNLNAAQNYGIKPGDVRRAAATLLSGLQVGSLFEEQKVFNVVVWGAPEVRGSLSDIRNLMIDTPGGGQVRLADVADVRVVSSPTVIKREAISPYLDIGLNVQGRDVGAVARDLHTAIQNFSFPLEYHAEILGSYAAQQASQQRLIIVGLVVVVGIFLLLQAATDNWPLAWTALLTLPAALAGGMLAALLSGSEFSLSSLFGLLTVLGIAARSCVLLIKHYQSLEQEGEDFGPDLVLRGSSERLAPILATTLAIGLALLPLVLIGNIPGLEIVRPVAIVILGGLFSTTLTNLFVIPALYLRFGASREADLDLTPAQALIYHREAE